ncbi:MAG: DivIVA domain-containing protein, partial [Actinomycetes bacterium]
VQRGDQMTLTPEDVRNKQFATVRFKEGYDLDEVDKFLDDVEAELLRLAAESDELRAQLARNASPPVTAPIAPSAPAAPPAAPVVPASEAAVAMLALAQKTADEHVANAKAEADRLLVAAKGQADAAASERENLRSTLEKRIEELRAFEREYRARLRTYIEGQLQELDTPSGDGGTPPRPAVSTPASAAPAAPTFGTGAGIARPSAPPPPPVPPVPPRPAESPFGGTIPTAPPREG